MIDVYGSNRSLNGRKTMRVVPSRVQTGILTFLLILAVSVVAAAQTGGRRSIAIPDIPGYLTLKCDFHTHTVFSDGIAWPTVRVQEAAQEGLDAIAISDHDDYAPHRPDIPISFHRPHEIARSAAETAGILIIPGLEISRWEPYGHHNAIFLTDIAAFPFWDNNAKAQTDTLASYRIAASQGAFLFWNHPWTMPPFWRSDKTTTWTAAQDSIYGNGWLGGIEIVNGKTYNAEAHRIALEKKLTIMGDTDIHNMIAYEYNLSGGEHRPMTLVFARERTLKGIKDALVARRTAVWSGDTLIGEAQYLRPIFEKTLVSSAARVELAPEKTVTVVLSNSTDIPVVLERNSGGTGIDALVEAPSKLTIPARQAATVRLRIRDKENVKSGTGKLGYRVTNFLVAPEKGLEATLPVEIVVRPAR